MQTIRVRRPHSYPIFISQKGSPLSEGIPSRRAIILTSPTVARFCLPTLKRWLKVSTDVLRIPDGERSKTLDTVARVYSQLIRLRADRTTPILLLGGGVVGDLGGFAAATYLRGVPFFQIPTTLVAQVDSSIGGKLGVDLSEGKNLVGLFQAPSAVFSYIPFLKTLPPREIRGGMAEVIKYGIIQDTGLFGLVQKKRGEILRYDLDLLYRIVLRSSKIKARIVSQDEKETTGLRRVLNFGHTFGHALERLTRYRRFHHGEAISIGMVIAARASHRLGFCSSEDVEAIQTTLRAFGLPTEPPLFPKERWVRALEVDKKSRDGMIHFVFVKGIGTVFVKPISPKELVKFL